MPEFLTAEVRMTLNNQVSAHIVYLGETGFPYGFAPIQRQLLIAKGLVKAGAHVLVVSHKGTFSKDQRIVPQVKGRYQNVTYIYTSGTIYRDESFLRRNALKIRGIIKEFMLCRELRQKQKLEFAIVATMRFQQILYYFVMSRILGFKVLLNYVEHNSAIVTRSSIRDRVNDLLIDLYALKCADAILPISTYLTDRVSNRAPGKPFLKIPILSDFSVDFPQRSLKENRAFVYCGSATYLELISFTLEAFDLLDHPSKKLHLVISGDKTEMEEFYQLIEACPAKESIEIFSRISYKELCQLYADALALLIPLRPTVQDEARFPHKIGEYLASGNPIVTTDFGEVKIYFRDMITALVANEYTPEAFSVKMKFVLDHPEDAQKIGSAGRQLAGKEFAYEKHGQSLLSFMKSLNQ
ncbi:MAG: glycosyltransferase [Saprospiraceae bacterium]|nr:glycosyltransferase [Saprospiraceae bacterium]